MTVAELKQYRSICRELVEKNIELKSKTIQGTVRGSDSEFPYTQHTMSVSGVESSNSNMRLLKRIDYLKRKKQEIEDFIDGIDDSLTRRIFELRYIKGRKKPSWQAIAYSIEEYDESYPRRKHEKYMKNIKLAENAENYNV